MRPFIVVVCLLGLLLPHSGQGQAVNLLPDEVPNVVLEVPFEAETLEFASRSGARDLVAINRIVVFLKSNQLWAYTRVFPMKSAQNAGTGSTVYGLGGLTANNFTLVNGPTWGISGLTFTTVQYATASDFLSGGNLTVFARAQITTVDATTRVLVRHWNEGANQRGFQTAVNSSLGMRLWRSTNGLGGTNAETYQDGNTSVDASIVTRTFQWVEGGGRSMWIDGVAQTLTITAGPANTSMHNSTADVEIMIDGAGVVSSVMFVASALGNEQRQQLEALLANP